MASERCELLASVLERYTQPLSITTLQVLFALQSVASVTNALFVFVAFGLLSCESDSLACSLISLGISSFLFVTFFILYAALEKFSLHPFAKNVDQLMTASSRCGISFIMRNDYTFNFVQRRWFGQIAILTTCIALVINLYKLPTSCITRRIVRSSLKKFRVKECASIEALSDEVCTICLDEMDNGILDTLSCGHSFHEACITKWARVSDSPSCPICKSEITGDNVCCGGKILSTCFQV